MHDARLEKLATVLVNHSTRVQRNETVLVEAVDIPEDMVITLIRHIRDVGGVPLVTLKSNRIQRELLHCNDEATMKLAGDTESYRMEKVAAYMGLRGSYNISETSDVPAAAMRLYEQNWLKPVHFEIRVPKTKWVVLRWPTPSMAQSAGMSTEAFENFYFDVCTMDYAKMAKAAEPLKELMQKTDQVHIVGPGTDLRFSIKDIPAIACSGTHNIPDGECFTAPVRDSVNGTISFNTATIYQGTRFSDIKLTFQNGRVVAASGSDSPRLNDILDADEGARYVGEFAIGFNPFITSPMLDILFDEKIAGSFHFTPGNAYDDADNGNRSAVHWDMVQIQTPELGGGELYFDRQLIRKDGRFVPSQLQALNPEKLK